MSTKTHQDSPGDDERLSEDPGGQLRRSVPSTDEQHRCLSDAAPRLGSFAQGFHEKRESFGADSLPMNLSNGGRAPAAVTAGAVFGLKSGDGADIGISPHTECGAVAGPVLETGAFRVPGPDDHIELSCGGHHRWEEARVVRQVGVHLTDDIDIHRGGFRECFCVGQAEAPFPCPVEHLDPTRELCG